jgi:hypothetical protein
VSGFKTWMHGGAPTVTDYVRRRERAWRWWDNPEVQRPLVSIVAVTPRDEFEAARPQKGVAVRVRCAWENTTQGLPKKPIAELVKLTLDGAPVSPELIAKRRPGGAAYEDHYHQFRMPDPAPGRHTATAVVRVIRTGAESSRAVEFEV